MWLIKSSIGRKVVMSVTGIALILFLTFHASMNVVALISAKGYNMICEFLGANWYAVVATVGLAGLVALHFIYAFWLTLQNKKARGNSSYEVTDKPKSVEWASQNMLVLGIIVILGMGLHLFNFWWNMMAAELDITAGNGIGAADGVGQIAYTFYYKAVHGYGCVYTAIYLVWLVALWFHLTHGFWSALQTLGWSGHVWFERWRCIGNVFCTLVVAMFAAVAIAFCAGWTPCDYDDENAVETECPMKGEGCCKGHKGGCQKAEGMHCHKDKMVHEDCEACEPMMTQGAN
ncbi:MAG: succinate dehydrogenase/fumarate reductase cytochrome b subunit [Bacteroidaceae bacterium]|nr:succinate dehydrogenase/fumarate reductase cytochrome b subunit [Bacteroidaceae bacterium]